MNGVWQKAADRMRDTLGQVSYETWIGPLSFVAMNNGTATIEAPNRFFRDWVSDRYLDLLRHSLSAEVGEPIDIKLTFDKAAGAPAHGNAQPNGNASSNGHAHKARSTGAAVCQMSRSGYNWRPRPSTFSKVFCSRINCGCTCMLKRRAVANSRMSTNAKEISFRGLLKMGSQTVRTADSSSSTRVPLGTQPDSTCSAAIRP